MTVTFPQGFRAAGVAAGLRSTGTYDVAVVCNDGPEFSAAGVFTKNRVQAAPVLYSRQVLQDGHLRAVVLNAGGANACTGSAGYRDTQQTAVTLSEELGIDPSEVAVCSTGLIGERLPMPELLAGVSAAAQQAHEHGGQAAAEAILTTDTRTKTVALGVDGYRIGGMAKGAGMLAPSLATMLSVLTTDARLEPTQAEKALRMATAVTFDRLDSDGCMSTNDTVLLLANGACGVTPDLEDFTSQLTDACADLARQMLSDAEGSTKDVAITVTGAASENDALEVARAVAGNNLVKCALFGSDPNWGRILAAVGTTTAHFDPDQLDVAMNGVWVCRNGTAAEDRSTVDLTGRDITITVDLHAGLAAVTVYTNDLSHAYVHENSAYSS
jgi:glutamate N-acetyltransferase / amino-acid N-acetyltransferase